VIDMRARRAAPLVVVGLQVVLAMSAGGGASAAFGDGRATSRAEGAASVAAGASASTGVAVPLSCAGSNIRLADTAGLPGIRLARYTDPTRTTMRLTNIGSLSAVVVPPANRSTSLWTAPYANPTDSASVAALQAVAAVADPNAVPYIPAGIPFSQVYFVPPGWSVCALTGRTGVPAEVRYLRDKTSSATYFSTRALAGPLVKYVTPLQIRRSQALVTCARNVADLVTTRPDLTDIDLYSSIISGATSCRNAYRMLLDDAAKAARTESRALIWLERAPRLLSTTRFFLAFVR
jgi:hypothetical protein